MRIIQSPSPNFSNSTYKKIGVQIHKTLGLMPGTLEWMQRSWAQVSAHYLITKKGEVHQLVQLDKRSWSAGRISKPNERAKKIMSRTLYSTYVKPGHYLIQVEFECLAHESFTSEQYKVAAELFNSFGFEITKSNFLTHKDTAIDKPNLDKEREEILGRLHKPEDCDNKRLVLDSWSQLRMGVKDGKIILYKSL